MADRILVVEDDENIGEVVAEYLRESGFSVTVAEDGMKADAWINATEGFDLYILDIMLPGITGLELLKKIRKAENTPVIMLTALDDEYTQLISFDGMADDYVTKPFSPKLLVKRVEAILRRSGKGGGLLQLGGIAVDVDGYEAFEDGQRVNLTLREFELLKVLMTHPGRVLSRQQLLNLVWGYDYFGDERIVDVHIKNVRKKITANLIVTVKGIGYKIEKDGGGKSV